MHMGILMDKPYHTGIVLYDYEITLTQRLGVGLERKVTVRNLPHSSDEAFRQKLLDALVNLGIQVSQHHITHQLKKK